MSEVIASLEQVTPGWLTQALSKSGALTEGEVAAFDVVTGRGVWSTNAILQLRYTARARGALPGRLFLKLVDADLGDEYFGASEVDYYTRDYVGVEGAPILRCYDAAFSEEQLRYHLLLDDLSETHIVAADKTPTLGYGLALAEGLAVMHARWWGARRLAEAGAPIHSAEHIRRFVEIAEPGAGHIIAHFSGELKAHWPGMMRDLYARHPNALIDRTGDGNGFTLIHGDANARNILAPRDADRPIYIVDRQPFDWSLTTWLGVYDLAYAMVLYWDVETRRRLELPVLRRYHEQLTRHGVNGYTWEQLFDDYRLCVPMGVYVATEWCRGGINEEWAWVWLTFLQRSLTACDDLDCSQLWSRAG